MHFDSVTINISDGLKQGDYAPNKTYSLTGIVTNADSAAISAGIMVLLEAGEAYLGRNATAAKVQVKRETKAKDPLIEMIRETAAQVRAEAGIEPGKFEPTPPADPLEGAAPKPADDPLEGAAPAAKEITNDEIVHAVMTKNAELQDATKIRALVETYNPAPGLRVFKATEIEQADRAGFLAKLGALTK
jgi:hypothetical protein